MLQVGSIFRREIAIGAPSIARRLRLRILRTTMGRLIVMVADFNLGYRACRTETNGLLCFSTSSYRKNRFFPFTMALRRQYTHAQRTCPTDTFLVDATLDWRTATARRMTVDGAEIERPLQFPAIACDSHALKIRRTSGPSTIGPVDVWYSNAPPSPLCPL